MYTLDDIMRIYQENEFPNNEDLYGRNKFAKEQRNFSWWYTWRRHQLERLQITEFSFEKQEIKAAELADYRLWWFQWLLKYYQEYVTENNFLTCEQAKIKHAILAPNLQNNTTLESIKQAIRSGKLKKTNMIGFKKNGINCIHDGTQRALAITQMIRDGEAVAIKINRYVQTLDDNKRYPYIDYYPEEKK